MTEIKWQISIETLIEVLFAYNVYCTIPQMMSSIFYESTEIKRLDLEKRMHCTDSNNTTEYRDRVMKYIYSTHTMWASSEYRSQRVQCGGSLSQRLIVNERTHWIDETNHPVAGVRSLDRSSNSVHVSPCDIYHRSRVIDQTFRLCFAKTRVRQKGPCSSNWLYPPFLPFSASAVRSSSARYSLVHHLDERTRS